MKRKWRGQIFINKIWHNIRFSTSNLYLSDEKQGILSLEFTYIQKIQGKDKMI